MSPYPKPKGMPRIPVQLTQYQFNTFILKHLPHHQQTRHYLVPRWKIFNYIMTFLYTGCQWKMLPIDLGKDGRPEIHYTQIFRIFVGWVNAGVFLKIFDDSVLTLQRHDLLDISIVHGDGTTTVAKKGGDTIGYSGHKHMKGEKIVAFVDRNCNVLSPMIIAPANRHEGPLFTKAFTWLSHQIKRIGTTLKGCILSLDSAYDSKQTRKMIFNACMVPNIKENKRNRTSPKKGRRRFFNAEIFEERFKTVERVFAWEDKFKRLLMRFERISKHHFGLKLLAYTMINLRHFC
jgi:transposase